MTLFEVYPLYDITPVRAKDVFVYDKNGQEYLDLYGGHAVISIGHAHPTYIQNLYQQLNQIGFYSNAIINPLQIQLAETLAKVSGRDDYKLFMCNSGAEANENALKLASFHTGKAGILAFNNSFHGRTSAAVVSTDNPKIIAPLNAQQQVDFLPLGDLDGVENILKKGTTCAVILECIQGVGGLDQSTTEFYQGLERLCNKYHAVLIADEVQSGFGRSGHFFAFQHHGITPHIISMAKGMGNGFPVGGILIHPKIKASYGLLGTTFGGNHLACAASLSVLEVLNKEKLMQNAQQMEVYFRQKSTDIPQILNLKGRGLMLGLEFEFSVAELRQKLLFNHHIFTGSSKNPNLIRILPPLTIKANHIDTFFEALKQEL